VRVLPITHLTRRRQIWAFLFIAVLMLLSAPRWTVFRPSGKLVPGRIRKPMRDLVLPELEGGDWKLASHHGQVIIITYWATWCEPCREELPGLMDVGRRSSHEELAIVAISMDTGPDAAARVTQFAARYRLQYPIAFPDKTGIDLHDLIRLPTTVLIDRQGRVARTILGEVERDNLAKDIAALLAEPRIP
jgi:cytochrome c biogenesis protein CcmG/thiol:disulfide interchange protein DsbE